MPVTSIFLLRTGAKELSIAKSLISREFRPISSVPCRWNPLLSPGFGPDSRPGRTLQGSSSRRTDRVASYSSSCTSFSPAESSCQASTAAIVPSAKSGNGVVACKELKSDTACASLHEGSAVQKEFSEVCFRAKELTSLAAPFVAEFKNYAGSSSGPETRQFADPQVEAASSSTSSTAMILKIEAAEAEKAADSLLALTSTPKFLHAVSELYPHEERRANVTETHNREHKSSTLTSERLRLHESFLKVTQWCILASAAPTDFVASRSAAKQKARLVKRAMELAIRGEKLGLPPHIPLYNQLAVACGVHVGPWAVLKVLASLQRLLFPQQISDAQPQFFEDCIKAMIRIGKYQEVVQLMKGMREDYTVEFRPELAFQVAKLMEEHSLHGMYEEEMLPFMEQMTESVQKHQSNMYQRVKKDLNASLVAAGVADVHLSYINSMLDDIQRKKYSTTLLDEKALEDEDEFDSDGTVVDMDELESIVALWEDDDVEVPVVNGSRILATDGAANLAKQVVLAAPGEEEEIHASSQIPRPSVPSDAVGGMVALREKLHREQCDEMIYIRDTASWILPDLVQSMMETTGEGKFFYTREFEEELIRQIEDSGLDDSDDDYSDDDDTYSDDDDDDDDDGQSW